MQLKDLLNATLKFKGDQLQILSDAAPKISIQGKIKTLDLPPLSTQMIKSWLEPIDKEGRLKDMTKDQPIELIYKFTEAQSFKINVLFNGQKIKANFLLIKVMKEGDWKIEELLDCFVEFGASDLHLSVGTEPKLRINGELSSIDLPKLTQDISKNLIYQILPEAKKKALNEVGGTDFGFSYKDGNRFRVSVLKQRGNLGAVLRIIPNTILTFEQTGLNPEIKKLLFAPRGLFLVTGPTGSGKSTTLASMIDFINKNRRAHILTIEEPIEFYHEHKKCVINQREVGVDVASFSDALRGALRQDPDVILVGEMRDFETIELAVTAAETGHLVFGTLHTTGAAETVDRIIDVFPGEQQGQVRAQLANGLAAIVSQQLIKRQDKKGRIAAFEILVATDPIRALIRDGKVHQIASFLQTGAKDGMNTLDDHLTSLYEQGIISQEDLVDKANNRKAMQSYLNQ